MSNKKKQQRRTSLPKIGKRKVKSQFEYDLYLQAKGNSPPRTKVEYEQDKFSYFLHKTYIGDLTITKKSGTILYIECKGLGRASDSANRSKLIAVKDQHPDIDLRIVFYKDGPISKNAKMKASEWATKNGFKFAIGSIPQEWLEE